MAMHNIGKFKIKTGEDGIAFRFGDGKIHRLGLGRKDRDAQQDYDEYNEEYMDGGDFAQDEYVPGDDYIPGGYSGRFAQPSSGMNDFEDFEEDFDGRYQDDYDDRYQDDFESGYADDDYEDDGYYDDGYGDEGAYDDRYLDEDAEGYDDDSYESDSPLMRFVDENDWVTYALLVLLPPLGIYLLWRRRRFEMPIRWAVSAASAIWFIILMILLISLIFSGSGDTTVAPPIEMTTPTPTIEAETTDDPASDELKIDSLNDLVSAEGMDSLGDFTSSTAVPGGAQDFLGIEPTATPIAVGSSPAGVPGASGAMSGDTVIITSTGAYYHNNIACTNLEAGASTSNVTKQVAEQRSKVACPVCYPNQKTYYATSTGTYYHVDIACSNMQGAAPITQEAAKNQGKTECPVCIKHEVNSLDNNALKFADEGTKDKSGVTVYATAGGRYFHQDATCSGMANATAGSLLNAMLAGKTACPKCCENAGTLVWCTEGGERYHNVSDCDGMQNAYQVTQAEAMILGKKRCTKCWGNSSAGMSDNSSTPSSSGTDSIYVYGTKNGKYYHTDSDCSGMSGASRYTLKSMISSGRAACPTCCSGAETVVYATQNGKYYHSYSTCSDMKNAQPGTLAQALAYGKQKCSECWAGSDGSSSGSSAVVGETASGSYVYCTTNGTYYHVKSNCSGMSGASKVQISAAVKDGKTACPSCAPAANYKIYSTSNGSYYHRSSSCSSMRGASQRTIEDAIVMGQSACPVCITPYLKANSSSSSSSSSGSSVSNVTTGSFSTNQEEDNGKDDKPTSSGKYSSGKSGIKVYATSTSKHYHTTSSCSGMTNASHVTLETAMNYGKTACSKCASSANTGVYAVKNGKYYHYSKSCAGSGAVKGKRAEALALGYDACPYCVTKTETAPEATPTAVADYKPGASGLKVYASVSGKYYHASKSCAGSGASKVTLETAMNYGKKPCSSCASSASKTVYSTGSDKYYHSSKTCAGPDSVSGSFAKALAMGKKECPSCIGGSEAYEQSDIHYSAPGDTNVYIDLDGNMLYYHKASRCEDAGVSGATKVELDFVLSWGFKACPYCCPPTSAD